ncbi:hypothetical protein YC2023_113205 [Brassica napus]
MDSYPFSSHSKFVELLSQQTLSFGNNEDSVELSSSQELRHDKKWCELATAKTEGSSKKRKCEDDADSSSSQATCSKRPPGVKVAKLSAKKPVVDEQTMNGFQTMWTIRQQDLASKSMLSKMSLLEGLIGKKRTSI